jgi:hypothetical protein
MQMIHTVFSGSATDMKRLSLGLLAVFVVPFEEKAAPLAVSLAPCGDMAERMNENIFFLAFIWNVFANGMQNPLTTSISRSNPMYEFFCTLILLFMFPSS